MILWLAVSWHAAGPSLPPTSSPELVMRVASGCNTGPRQEGPLLPLGWPSELPAGGDPDGAARHRPACQRRGYQTARPRRGGDKTRTARLGTGRLRRKRGGGRGVLETDQLKGTMCFKAVVSVTLDAISETVSRRCRPLMCARFRFLKSFKQQEIQKLPL